MRHPLFKLGPVLWGLCASLLLIPHPAVAGEPSLTVDLDGDGQHDSIRLDHDRPSILRIWLSASDTTQVLVSRGPLHRVAAIDLDGDHRPELIASDSESRIHVWTHRASAFHRYQPRQAIPPRLASTTGPRLDGRNREPEEVLAGGAFGPSALARTSPPDRTDDASSVCVAPGPSTCLASPAVQPFSPRPPPVQPHSRPVRRRI